MTGQNPHDRTDPPPSDRRAHTVDLADGNSVVWTVVNAVAAVSGRSPLDLEPLSTQVDPEALEALVHGPVGRREGLSISFRYAGHTVVVAPPTIRVQSNSPDG